MSLISAQNRDIPFEKQFFKEQKDLLKEALRNIKDGDMIYEIGFSVWPRAIEFYEKANDFNPDNSYLNYKLGNCYLYSIHKSRSLDFFKKAFSLNPSVARDIHKKTGRALHLGYNFDEAIKEYQLYRNVLDNSVDQDEIISVAK